MAVTNLYPNLPGHLVEFKDGGLQLTTENADASGSKSLLILGTAFDGPINEPVKIDKTTVSQLFGSDVNEKGYPNGATLTKYAKQAFKNGFTDVRCMRVTGSRASVEISKTASVTKEELFGTPVNYQVAGNAEATITLANSPIIPSSVQVKSAATGLLVQTSGYKEYDPSFKIAAGTVSKNTQLVVEYDYNTVEEKTLSSAVADDTGAAFKTIALDFDPAAQQSIYETTEAGISCGIEVTVDGVVLTAGSDYTVAGNVLSIVDGGQVALDDTVEVKYYVATTTHVDAESHDLVDTADIVTLPVAPIAGSVTVTVAGKDVTDFSVDGANVSLDAGKFVLGQTAVIKYKYEKVTEHKESMTIRSIYGGSVYKEASVAITEYTNETTGEIGRKFTFTKPESKMYSAADVPFFVTSFDCPTVGALKQAIANYALNNVFEIVADDEDILTNDFPAFSGTLSDGGDDGVVVTNDQLYEALSGKRDNAGYLIEQGAYQILENYNVDYIYPAGVYADSKQSVNPYSSFHQELALLCAVLTYRTKMTHGFIDVKPNSNTTLVGIQKYVDSLVAYNNIHYMKDSEGNDITDSEGNKMDIGWYTSVVVGPEPVMVSDTLGTYYGSPAIAYAALNAALKPQSAPTNKALPGVKGMKYKFSNKQMNELVGNRMVVFKLKNEGTATASSVPYVVDGCTAGAPNCDYGRLSTVKVVTDVVDQIREVSDPFIGEPNTIEQRNALSALISKRLSYLLEQGEILHYEFEINATLQQVVLGECSIALTLVCPMELRKITTVVALRAAA